MIKLLFAFIPLMILMQGPIKAQMPNKQEKKNGMTVRWRVMNDSIHFTVVAPTKGWVAIGFNRKNQLSGTNLIMGAAEFDHYKLDDRYILRPGEHRSVISLGGEERTMHRHVKEENGQTTMKFSLPIGIQDEHHPALNQGQQYHVLLAYSRSVDFMHHSIMRTSINLTL